METTYSATVDDIECAFFDQVEVLRNFGSCNKETISQLVWAFFNYWAYRHDYANSVISVRTGSILRLDLVYFIIIIILFCYFFILFLILLWLYVYKQESLHIFLHHFPKALVACCP